MNAEGTLRLLHTWENATPAQVHEGWGWYQGEAEQICRMVDLYAPTIEHGRALVAMSVLSPGTTWERLSASFGPWLRDPTANKLPCYRRNVERAEEVLAGRAWIPDERTAPKTHHFARALLGDPFATTIDLWMLRIMNKEGLDLTPTRYQECARSVRDAANTVYVPPREFQAVVWVAARGGQGTL